VNGSEFVADASAVLALLKREPFRHFDPARLVGASISAVNLSEVLGKLREGGLSENEAAAACGALELGIVAFDHRDAAIAAELLGPTRRAGLSLADRACLALALRLGRPAVTADRAWPNLDIGAEIVLVR
jgi:ribonuclease VapC